MQFFHEVRTMPPISLSKINLVFLRETSIIFQPNVAGKLDLYQGVKSNFVLTDDLMGGLNASRTLSLAHLRKRLWNLVHSLGGFDYRDASGTIFASVVTPFINHIHINIFILYSIAIVSFLHCLIKYYC